MKFWLYIFSLFAVLSCKQGLENKSVEVTDSLELKDEKSFDWLAGKWKRVSNDTVYTTFETWKGQDENYIGHGFVMQDSDTIWEETMLLHQVNGNWSLDIETPGNDDLVSFRMTEHTSLGFTVENPDHDFPSKIEYFKEGKELKANVSGGEKRLEYIFRKLE